MRAREEPEVEEQGASGAPRATIVIPSYNHARFVLGAVASALDQTEPAIEVLVIDDGSSDDSVARLGTIDDPRVTVLAQPNAGLSNTLNRGLALARSRWVKFLPSDDLLAPRCIERELEVAASASGIGLVFCLPEIVDADGRPLADPAPQAWFDTPALDEAALLCGLVERNFLSAPGALFDCNLARAVGGFDPGMRVAQDYDLWLKMLARCSARLVEERLVRVRWHGANQSAVATPATEAERARALGRALEPAGLAAWVARFAAESGGDEGAGRLALARALVRSGLAELRPLARELVAEARRRGVAIDPAVRPDLAALDLDAVDAAPSGWPSQPYRASRGADLTGAPVPGGEGALPEARAAGERAPASSLWRRVLRAAVPLARRAARVCRRRPRGNGAERRSARSAGTPAVASAGAPGPRERHWLIVAGSRLTSGDRPPGLARALARRGARVTLATRGVAGGAAAETAPGAVATGESAPRPTPYPTADPPPGSTRGDGIATVQWERGEMRRLVASADERLRVLVELPHPEAVALAREAGPGGARVVYDRTEAWDRSAELTWYDVETERALVRASDDLVAVDRRVAAWLAVARRPVHILPSPGASGAGAAGAWDALAASLEAVAAQPTVAVIVVCRDEGSEIVERTIEGLVAWRGDAAYRIVAVDAGSRDGTLARLEAREATGEIVVFRSAHPSPVAGRNLALRATASEIAAFLAVGAAPLGEGWLAPAVDLLLEHRELGAVGCSAWPAAGGDRSVARAPERSELEPWWTEAPAVAGPLLVVPRAALAAVGGFDESLSRFDAADLDLGRRLRAAGYRLAACAALGLV